MRTETVTRRVGEYLGPVDWTFDFTQFDWGSGKSGVNPFVSMGKIETLRLLESAPELYQATTDGGWPKFGWQRVVNVGMENNWAINWDDLRRALDKARGTR